MESLFDGQEHWVKSDVILLLFLTRIFSQVSNLSNASSLIFNSLLAFPKYSGSRAVNWCGEETPIATAVLLIPFPPPALGFYIDSALFPSPRIQVSDRVADDSNRLLLGPFCGKPACQFIQTAPGKARGVCADAYLQAKTIVVPEVNLYPGHIACDAETKSDIVCPLVLHIQGEPRVLGVLDLDCLVPNGFDHEDKVGLEKIANLIVKACNW